MKVSTARIQPSRAEAYYRKVYLGSAAYCFQRIGREGLAGTLAVLVQHQACRILSSAAPTRIPWLTVDPLPTIRAKVNGYGYGYGYGYGVNLALDTCAGDTVLNTEFAVDAAVPSRRT